MMTASRAVEGVKLAWADCSQEEKALAVHEMVLEGSLTAILGVWVSAGVSAGGGRGGEGELSVHL